MKNTLFVIALFSCLISANAQVRPDQAIEKTTAEDTDEIYSQYNGLLRRIKFSTAKTYFQTGLTLLDLGISDGTSGQVLTTDGSGNFSFTTVSGGGSGGTDDQTLSFAGTTLSIEDGNSVDLSSLQDGTGTDDQTIDVFSLAGTTLSLSLESDGQAAQTVDLSSLQDGTGTDDQTSVEVSFSPTGNISSSDVQSMGEELQTQIDGLQTTSGVVNGATNLGTFSGSTISDNTTTKAALQELETAVESSSGSYTVTDNTPQTLSLSRSLSMNDLSVADETVINRQVTISGTANTSNNNSTIYTNSTTLQTDASTNKQFINTNDILTIDATQGFTLDGKIVNYNTLLNDRSTTLTSNTTAAVYTYKKDRTSGTASNGVALEANVNAQNGTITNAKALDINVTEVNGTNTNAIGIQINDIEGTTQYAIKQDGADDLNQFSGQVTIQNILNLVPILGADAPASPSEGDVIIVSDTATSPFTVAGMYLYLGSAWSKL
jgi:hypothetical protein